MSRLEQTSGNQWVERKVVSRKVVRKGQPRQRRPQAAVPSQRRYPRNYRQRDRRRESGEDHSVVEWSSQSPSNSAEFFQSRKPALLIRDYLTTDVTRLVTATSDYRWFRSQSADFFINDVDQMLKDLIRVSSTDSRASWLQSTIMLRRNVEMFQWTESKETETKVEIRYSSEHTEEGQPPEEIEETVEEIKFTYHQKWVDHKVSSDGFRVQDGHSNARVMNRLPSSAKLGRVKWQIDHLRLQDSKVLLSEEMMNQALRKIDVKWEDITSQIQIDGWEYDYGYLYQRNLVDNDDDDYNQQHLVSPKVGDLRMTVEVFALKQPREITILGSLVPKPYKSSSSLSSSFSGPLFEITQCDGNTKNHNDVSVSEKNGDQSSKKSDWTYLKYGHQSKEEVLRSFELGFDSTLFYFRLLSLFLMVGGFVMSSSLVRCLVLRFPLIGQLLSSTIVTLSVILGVLSWIVIFSLCYVFAHTIHMIGIYGIFGLIILYWVYQTNQEGMISDPLIMDISEEEEFKQD